MFRHITARPALRSTNQVFSRSFSAARPVMAEGDTGAPKAQGSLAGKDAFSSREKANEDMYVRQQEMDKLAKLRADVKEKKAHLEKMEKHIEELSKNQGGEQN